ncbi:MAG TPA: glucosamine-6-phosphate deaminase [Clostridiaceae bacterium]|nr:glucosamine-6-phosphate deaminase [Clostridiaceae bacterium]
MDINIFKDYDELSRKTADFISNFVNNNPKALLCFPAGDSPLGTFKKLVEYSNEGIVSFKYCRFVGLDEWVGMEKNNEGSCKYFIYKNLFEPLCIDETNICFFDACSKDLISECKRIDKYILNNGGIDLMLLGVGMNGHIGLNEPGVSFKSYSHVTELDDITVKVAQKYFKEKKMIKKGITLGIKHVMDAKTVVLLANGIKKADIVKKLAKGEVTNKIPASILQMHKNSYLFLDKEAASLLE